jgi:spore coat protein CotH
MRLFACRVCALALLGLFFGENAVAQGNNIFNDTILHRIEIDITLSNWFDTLENDYVKNSQFPDSIPEIYRYCDIRFDGVAVPNCGIRQKGNFSNIVNRGGLKAPFKIAFDAFVEKRFDGLKKINLSNFTNDPTLLHDPICYSLLQDNGIPAPRTSYAKVYFNGTYWGLYLIVENIDKTYLKRHFGTGTNDEGNVYRTSRQSMAFLQWKGSDTEANLRETLKLTTNEEEDDWSGLVQFVDRLNNTPDDSLPLVLPQIFDVDGYLKILAIEKLVQNWDSYWGGGNNFALYEHPNGRFYFLPWDMNETLQGAKFQAYTDIFDGYLYPVNRFGDRPLLGQMFKLNGYRQAYFDTVCALINGSFSVEHLQQRAIRWQRLVANAYLEDPNKINTYADFANGLVGWHKDQINMGTASNYALRFRYMGIFEFIRRQQQWAQSQLGGWDYACDLPDVSRNEPLAIQPNPSEGSFFLKNAASDGIFCQIRIYHTTGALAQLVPFQWYVGEQILVVANNLPNGLYWVQLVGADGGTGVGKWMKS